MAQGKKATPEQLERLRKAKERADRLRPPMTATGYWGKVQTWESQADKLLLAAKQVEIWESPTWGMIWGCFDRVRRNLDALLDAHGNFGTGGSNGDDCDGTETGEDRGTATPADRLPGIHPRGREQDDD